MIPLPSNESRSLRRRGVASFELVMSFPILVFLFAMLYCVYIATMMKSQLTMEVRHTAWLARTAPQNSQPFSILQADSAGESRAELSRTVKVYSNWYPNVPREIHWGNVVLTGSWDYRQVPFNNGFFSTPHFEVLMQMVEAQGGVPTDGNTVSNLGGITNIPH